MSDAIRISRIAVFAFHGVLAEEQTLGQRFFITLDCRLPLAEAGRDDDLGKSVDYGALTERVQELAVTRIFRTLEGLAYAIADTCLAEFALLSSVTATIEKPSAPIPAILDNVAVSVTRTRDNA